MAKNNSAASTVVLCLILVWASVPASESFERPAPVPAREEDVRLVKCGACKKVAEQLYRHQQAQIPHQLLADQGTEGICDAECKTMQEACNEVMEGADLVSDFLNEPDPHLDGIVHYVCKNVTTPCKSKHSPAAEGTLEALRLGEADEDDDEDTDLAPKPVAPISEKVLFPFHHEKRQCLCLL